MTELQTEILIKETSKLLKLSLDIRRNGIEILKARINDYDDNFLKFICKIIYIGIDPKLSMHIITNLIEHDNIDDFTKKTRLLQRDILFNVDENPNYVLNYIAFSYFGFSYYSEYQSKMKEVLSDDVYSSLYDGIDFMY